VGFMGHSLGGGAVPYLARKGVVERGWGKRGVLLFVMAPWYLFGVTQQDLETFPPHAKLIMQVYDNDFTNDHRMAKDVFENISIPSSEKEYVTLFSDSWSSCTLDADHFTPLATGISFGKEDALDYYGVYRLFDALAAYTFTSDTAGKALALAHGSAQQRFMGKWPGGPYVRELSATAYPEITHPESYYQNPWSNEINPRRSQDLGPLVYWLGQNHPNPFNSSTKISFSLPVAGPVVLSVHDVLGRSVAVLVNGMVNAGEHQLDFTPVNLSSGVYFVRMQSDGYSQQRSIVYLK